MAHRVPLLRAGLDESGTDIYRSLEDIRRIDLCPLQDFVFKGKDSQCAARTAKDLKQLKCLALPDRQDLDKRLKERMHVMEPHIPAIIRLCPNSLKDQDESFEERLQNFETQKEKIISDDACMKCLGEFTFLVDVFEKLYTNPWIRRAHIYRQLADLGVFSGNSMSHETGWLVKFYYIVFPMLVFFFAFGFQSFMLHLATHYYIFYMDNEKGDNEREEEGGELLDLFGNLVGKLVSGDNGVSGQGAVYDGKVNFPLAVLDATAAIPLFFCMSAYIISFFKTNTFNIGLWNKTFIVASLMAVSKGILDVVTIMPDSTGWKNCKERLGEKSGLQALRDLDFIRDFWGSILSQLSSEILGGGGKNGSRVRYCADMMVSGHTYFACLFSLSAYKQIAHTTEVINSRRNVIVRNVVFIICIACLLLEVVLVAAARFHYTVDMLVAIMLVFLLFDSRFIEQLAADWSEGYQWRDPKFVGRNGFQHRFLCRKPNTGQLIPSQSTCFNHRLIVGKGLYVEPDDDLTAYSSLSAYPADEDSRGSPVHGRKSSRELLLQTDETSPRKHQPPLQ